MVREKTGNAVFLATVLATVAVVGRRRAFAVMSFLPCAPRVPLWFTPVSTEHVTHHCLERNTASLSWGTKRWDGRVIDGDQYMSRMSGRCAAQAAVVWDSFTNWILQRCRRPFHLCGLSGRQLCGQCISTWSVNVGLRRAGFRGRLLSRGVMGKDVAMEKGRVMKACWAGV